MLDEVIVGKGAHRIFCPVFFYSGIPTVYIDLVEYTNYYYGSKGLGLCTKS